MPSKKQNKAKKASGQSTSSSGNEQKCVCYKPFYPRSKTDVFLGELKYRSSASEASSPALDRRESEAENASEPEASGSTTPVDLAIEAGRLKDEGNAAFKAGDYTKAKEKYSEAIGLSTYFHVFLHDLIVR